MTRANTNSPGEIRRRRAHNQRKQLRKLESHYGKPPEKVDCAECTKPCGLVDGRVIYPHRPDLASKMFWRCCACGAYVGCHRGTTVPLGTTAGPVTQRARREAHAAFDPLWLAKMERDGCSKSEARQAAYAWLAEQLELPPEKTHIGMFDVALARRVVEVCSAIRTRAA